MKARAPLILLAVASLAGTALSGGASAQQLYRWVDDEGVVHYGDRVPPEYASSTRDVLNRQGIAVRSESGAPDEEALAEQARLEAQAAAEREARADVARRDRMLLETYLSVADIEDVRDQRLEMLESQVSVTEQYLANLRRRLEGLHREASVFSPYNEDENARPVPAQLASEIARAESSIRVYEQNLERTREEQESLRESFARDIERFQELKGG